MKKMLVLAAALGLALALTPQRAAAQVAPSPEDVALTQCISRATTSDDDIVLMRWIFIAMARHPSVSQLVSITDAERVDANRRMGALMNRLLLDACPNEARTAFAKEGAEAVRVPFSALGERAMTEIMGNPDVSAGVGEVAAYIDENRLAALMGRQAPAQTPKP